MGYRSDVALKTTTEGYVLFKKYNDSITEEEAQPLRGATIQKTEHGFYKISFDCVKWYDGYDEVDNFMEFLDKLEEYSIPFTFARIGEDRDDIEVRQNWTDDMPDEIGSFGVYSAFDDPSEGGYEEVSLKEGDE